MTTASLVFYGRPGCHLCDDARLILEQIAGELSLSWCEFNIETDDQIHKRYLVRIPVLAAGDEILAELIWDQDELRTRLESVAAGR